MKLGVLPSLTLILLALPAVLSSPTYWRNDTTTETTNSTTSYQSTSSTSKTETSSLVVAGGSSEPGNVAGGAVDVVPPGNPVVAGPLGDAVTPELAGDPVESAAARHPVNAVTATPPGNPLNAANVSEPVVDPEPAEPSERSSNPELSVPVANSEPEPVVFSTPEPSAPISTPEPAVIASDAAASSEPSPPASTPEPEPAPSNSNTCPPTGGGNTTLGLDSESSRQNDTPLLTLLLTLAHLAHAFYTSALAKYDAKCFADKGYEPWVRGRYAQIAEMEGVHVRFLEEAIGLGGGGGDVGMCVYNFPDTEPHHMIELSEALSNLLVSSFTGALKHVESKEYASALGSILGVEARVAVWVNSAVKKQNAWNQGFETPLTPSQTWSLAQNFISSCPSSTTALLPSSLTSFPPIHLPAHVEAGYEVEVSFDPRRYDSRKAVFGAFMVGTGTYLQPVTVVEERVPVVVNLDSGERGEKSGSGSGVQRYYGSGDGGGGTGTQKTEEFEVKRRFYVTPPQELQGAGVVYVMIVQAEKAQGEAGVVDVGRDESMVAGPGVLMFPFNSRGEAGVE